MPMLSALAPTAVAPALKPVTIGGRAKPQLPLGLGGSWFVPYSAPGEQDDELLDAIAACYEAGLRHFDTGAGYELRTNKTWAIMTFVGSVAATLAVWAYIFSMRG